MFTFLRRGEGRGGGGDSWAALNQFYQELGDTFHHPLLRIASLDVRQSPRLHADAVGAHIITGAARATVATGRVAVAIGEADVAALLADGARRRAVQAESLFWRTYTLTRFRNVCACELTCLKTQGRRLLRRSMCWKLPNGPEPRSAMLRSNRCPGN